MDHRRVLSAWLMFVAVLLSGTVYGLTIHCAHGDIFLADGTKFKDMSVRHPIENMELKDSAAPSVKPEPRKLNVDSSVQLVNIKSGVDQKQIEQLKSSKESSRKYGYGSSVSPTPIYKPPTREPPPYPGPYPTTDSNSGYTPTPSPTKPPYPPVRPPTQPTYSPPVYSTTRPPYVPPPAPTTRPPYIPAPYPTTQPAPYPPTYSTRPPTVVPPTYAPRPPPTYPPPYTTRPPTNAPPPYPTWPPTISPPTYPTRPPTSPPPYPTRPPTVSPPPYTTRPPISPPPYPTRPPTVAPTPYPTRPPPYTTRPPPVPPPPNTPRPPTVPPPFPPPTRPPVTVRPPPTTPEPVTPPPATTMPTFPPITFPPVTTPTTTTTRRTTTTTQTTTTSTIRPPFTTTTTRRPIFPPPTLTPIVKPPATSTEPPNIGTEGPDEEEDEPIFTGTVPILRPNSLRSNIKTMLGNPVRSKAHAIKHSNNTLRRDAARSMRFNEDPNVVTDFVFSDIKCLKTRSKELFTASIYLKSGFHVPYIRDRPQDPLTNSECKMERLDKMNAYKLTVTDFRACGVEMCDGSMCLTLVFPRVPTLALADDEVTTIRCLPQKASMGEIKSISFVGDNGPKLIRRDARRSSSTVEGGKQEFAAEVGVFRQNPGANNGVFIKRVNSGGVVQLGEPLQLRSVVRGGDGWYHSKLSEVKIWRMRKPLVNVEELNPQDASEVITLVNADGCRNPEYEVIANSHPVRDPRNTLLIHFTFKAFLFRGQKANEPLIITARVKACQEPGECEDDCDRNTKGSPVSNGINSRFKRSPVEHNNSSSIIHDFNSQLSLRVVGLDEDPLRTVDYYPDGGSQQGLSCTEKMTFTAVGSGMITLLLCATFFSLVWFTRSSMRLRKLAASETGRIEAADGGEQRQVRQYVRGLQWSSPSTSELIEDAESRCETRMNNQKYSNQISVINTPELHRSALDHTLDSRHSRRRRKGPEDEDGVYIVYCCNDDKLSSRSAPSSLRSRYKSTRRGRYYNANDDDSDESDLHPMSEKLRNPKTVRSVKRTYKSRGTKIRRRLSSIYREVYASKHRNSVDKNNNQGLVKEERDLNWNKFSNAPTSTDPGMHLRSDGVSTHVSSDLDSAYSGSGQSNQGLLRYGKPQVNTKAPVPAPRMLKDKSEVQSSIQNSNNKLTAGLDRHYRPDPKEGKPQRILVLPATDV